MKDPDSDGEPARDLPALAFILFSRASAPPCRFRFQKDQGISSNCVIDKPSESLAYLIAFITPNFQHIIQYKLLETRLAES